MTDSLNETSRDSFQNVMKYYMVDSIEDYLEDLFGDSLAFFSKQKIRFINRCERGQHDFYATFYRLELEVFYYWKFQCLASEKHCRTTFILAFIQNVSCLWASNVSPAQNINTIKDWLEGFKEYFLQASIEDYINDSKEDSLKDAPEDSLEDSSE